MSEKKQTAIEFLEQEYYYNFGTLTRKDFEKAKELQKEQMIDFGFNTYCYISGIMKVPFEQISENGLHAEQNFIENYEH